MPDPRRPDEPEPIADAASVFDSGELRVVKPRQPAPAPVGPEAADEDEGYGLELDPAPPPRPTPPPVFIDEPEADVAPLPMTGQRPGVRPKSASREVEEPGPAPVQRTPITTRPTAKSRAQAGASSGSSNDPGDEDDESEGERSEVDPEWSRSLEWGPDVVRVALVGLATLVLLWFTSGSMKLMALAFLVGGAATVLLAYPILITLERPVRITPEHAVGDFYAAASHHFPHYRRMWLLLSAAGRESGPFRDFDHFRAAWRGRIESWKRDRAGRFTPLRFEVGDFRADKSTGKSTTTASYSVRIFVRGEDDSRPLAAYNVSHGLIKGSDRMWYLNRGSLPTGRGQVDL